MSSATSSPATASPLREAYVQAMISRFLQIISPQITPAIREMEQFFEPLRDPDTAFVQASYRFVDGEIDQAALSRALADLQRAWQHQFERYKRGEYTALGVVSSPPTARAS